MIIEFTSSEIELNEKQKLSSTIKLRKMAFALPRLSLLSFKGIPYLVDTQGHTNVPVDKEVLNLIMFILKLEISSK